MFLTIAWRNIWRNPYRSTITILAVAFGLAALIFLRAFAEGAHRQMIDNYTELVSGHLQIHHRGFQQWMGLDRSIADPQAVIAALEATPHVVAWTPRVKEYALASSAEHSSGILLLGIDPTREPAITRLHQRIPQGTLPRDPTHIVIGKALAETLGVRLDEKVVVMGQGADGSLAAGAFRVCGLLDTGTEELDQGLALITVEAAQELLVLNGKVSEFAVRTDGQEDVDTVIAHLTQRLNPEAFEVLSWKAIAPVIVQWIEYEDGIANLIILVVLFVAAAGVLNTLLMGVLERTREFGILLAIGTKRRQLILMVVLESCFLGLVGVALGSVGGALVSGYFATQGVDLRQFASALEGEYVGSIIYLRLRIEQLAALAGTVLTVCAAASLYPAWRASRLKPVEAIRQF